MPPNPTILAIESSCDDTSVAILQGGQIRSNVVSSQHLHKLYGGIVPEVASRSHMKNLVLTAQLALEQAKIAKDEIDSIAVTEGPGLLGSLMVGVSFAKAMAMSMDVPLIGVHHMEAHILAHFIDLPHPSFPFICLTVSGGHTQLIKVNSHLNFELLGSTLDDAAGEAFDKIGKMMGLTYPAGPQIDRLAKNGTVRFDFPEPKVPDLNFSFSGLKTAVLYFLRDQVKTDSEFITNNLEDLCASIQFKIVQILMNKLIAAARITQIKEIAIAGGVAANSALRLSLSNAAEEFNWKTYIPKIEYCTDNSAMIAKAAFYKYLAKQFSSLDLMPKARIPI